MLQVMHGLCRPPATHAADVALGQLTDRSDCMCVTVQACS